MSNIQEISSLMQLVATQNYSQYFSIYLSYNKLTQLPVEIGHLTQIISI